MRLTVRTLLAWLDHVLPVDEQLELDVKVAASPVAQQLVTRIRQVVARPTIPSPRLDGRGLAAEPNSVAEYLDNCLPHDRLEAFERICVDSDMHLAEVAACHDILATVARDPVATAPLDAAGRRRLLEAMGHHSATVFSDIERRESMSNARAIRAAIEAAPEDARPVTPSRRRSSRAAWAAAIVALALLVALGVFLIEAISRPRLRRGERPAAPEVALDAVAGAAPALPPPNAVVAVPAEEPAVNPAEAPAVEADPSPAVEVAGQPLPAVKPEDKPGSPDAGADEPAGVADAPAVAQPPAMPVAQPRVPQGDALAIAAPASPAATAAVATPGPAGKPGPPSADQASLGFVGGDGLVFHRVAGDGRSAWAALAPGAALGSREDLIVPFGFQPDVNVRGVTIRLLPGTRVAITTDADGGARLEVVFGRAVVRASRPDAKIGVTAGGLVGAITAGLAEPTAIAVALDRFPGSDPTVEAARVRASVIAANGGIVWRQGAAGVDARPLEGIAAEGMLDSRTAISWESTVPGAGRVARLDPLPPWTTAPAAIDKLERNAAAALAARTLETASLDQALRELAVDRRVENRVLAASTLALLGDFDDAVELLCADAPGRRLEQRQWSKLEDDVVPLALSRGANAAAKLRTALENRGPHGKAETLYAMARGFTDDELAAGAAEALVAALDDADLVVRRYAIKCLCDIVQPAAPDRLRYRPDGLPDLRREGVSWWRGQLQKGLIRRQGAA